MPNVVEGGVAFRRALIISGLVLMGPCAEAELTREDCVVSDVRPEAIDLDKPRDQLARQSDLVIPEGARVASIRIIRRPIFDTSDPEQDNADTSADSEAASTALEESGCVVPR